MIGTGCQEVKGHAQGQRSWSRSKEAEDRFSARHCQVALPDVIKAMNELELILYGNHQRRLYDTTGGLM